MASDAAKLTPNAKKILLELINSKDAVHYSMLRESLSMPDGTLQYNLDRLEKAGLITRAGAHGPYKLSRATPWLILRRKLNPDEIAYLGLIGKKGEADEPITLSTIKALREDGLEIDPDKGSDIVLVTSREGFESWEGEASLLSQVTSWIICEGWELWEIESVEKKVERVINTLTREKLVVLDCTGDGKPAALALYRMASNMDIPLVYLHRKDGEKSLRWLVSKKDIAKKYGIDVRRGEEVASIR